MAAGTKPVSGKSRYHQAISGGGSGSLKGRMPMRVNTYIDESGDAHTNVTERKRGLHQKKTVWEGNSVVGERTQLVFWFWWLGVGKKKNRGSGVRVPSQSEARPKWTV